MLLSNTSVLLPAHLSTCLTWDKQKFCLPQMTDSSTLTFDLQLCIVGQVPLCVGHVTFVDSWNISRDGGQRQATIEHLNLAKGKDEEDQREGKKVDGDHEPVTERTTKAICCKEISKLQLLHKMLILKYLIKILQMPSVYPPHFYFFMFLNRVLIFMPDDSWPRVAMGSTAERQRVSEQNLHKSWWGLDKHRWS